MTEVELHTLCRDRELVTPELHESNDFYGHAALLKRYAARPALSSLKVAIEHGVILNDYVWQQDVTSGMPLFLCASSVRAHLFAQRRTKSRAVPIGPMPYYVKTEPVPAPTRHILLAFPSHSSHRVKAVFDAQAFAQRLAEVGKDYDDVHVCVYWRDVQSGLDRLFRERGFTCVSAGHMFDAAFLPRLLRLLSGAAAAMTNEVGSAVLYAAFAGKPVWIEPQHVDYVASEDVLAVDTPDFADHPTVETMLLLFNQQRADLSVAQRTFAADVLGMEHVKSPAQIAALLAEAESCYRNEITIRRRLRDGARRLHYLRARVKQELKNRWP
jgi:hypothetical protein